MLKYILDKGQKMFKKLKRTVLIFTTFVLLFFVASLFITKPAYAATFNIAVGDVDGLIDAINEANVNGVTGNQSKP